MPCGAKALDGISLGAKTTIPTMCILAIYSRFLRGMVGGRSGLRCSQEKHLELHRILAKCLESGDFVPYEIAIKAECPHVTYAIAETYM